MRGRVPDLSARGLLTAAALASVALMVTAAGGDEPSSKPLPIGPHGPAYLGRRAEWFRRPRAYPLEHIPAGMRLKALGEMDRMIEAGLVSSTDPWQLIGPQPSDWPSGFSFSPTSGRVTALAVDPRNSEVVYLGGAVGGVWKTTDGGTAWAPLTDTQASLSVGSIALDPSNPDTVYVGTGEDDFGGDNYYGAGILKSTDSGATWTQISGPFVGASGSDQFCGGAFIGALAVSPRNSQVILAGAAFFCAPRSGVYLTTNGGASWTKVLGGSPGTAVFFDPTTGNAYAALGNPFGGNTNNGVYISTNGGTSWTTDDGTSPNTLPAATSMGRIALAEFPGNPPTLYAGVAGGINTSSPGLLGVFKSTDGGAGWTKLSSVPPYCDPTTGHNQCWYDNVVAVNSKNSNMILVGGSGASFSGSSTVFQSLDGGTTWADITKGPDGAFVHPDMHAIAFASDGSKFYVGNDGGAWSTTNVGQASVTWTNLNNSLAITQFYPNLSTFPNNLSLAYGGTQDNGTQVYQGALAWQNAVTCGDGGQTAIDPTVTSTQIGTVYVGCAYIPPNTRNTFLLKIALTSPSGGGFASPAQSGINGSDPGMFIPPLAIDPSNPQTLYFGTNHVYQTTNGAEAWTAMPPTLAGKVSAIAVAPANPNAVYAGSDQGALIGTSNAGAGTGSTWSAINTGIPNRAITALAVDFANPNSAYVALSGFSGFGDTLGHVFKTSNGGTSWSDISGNLPNIPVNDIVVDPDIANTLYVATDIGVFTTADGGATWSVLGTGLPRTAILSLKLIRSSRTLRAASHGRSAWDFSVPGNLPVVELSPAQLNFGSVPLNTSASQTITLTNNGTSLLNITSISTLGINSSDFVQHNNCGASVAAGASCSINVVFTPSAAGTRSATLSVADNGPGSPQTAILTGAGVIPDFSLSSTPASATLTAGTTAVLKLSVAPVNGFNQTIALTCAGQPALSTCAVSPTSVTPNGTSATTATVTVVTTARTLTTPRGPFEIPPTPSRPREAPLGLPWLAALGATAFALFGRKRRLALLFVIAILLTWVACGGGSSVPHSPGTPPGTYTLTLTGTSGALAHSITVSLTVN